MIEMHEPENAPLKTFTRSELKDGILYKINGIHNPNDFFEYDTLYTKAGKNIVFFQDGRLNIEAIDDDQDVFIEAPKGTYVTIKNI